MERDPHNPDEIWGDYPHLPEEIPGVRKVDDIVNPKGLLDRARQHLREHPDVRKVVREKGQDLVAWTTAHGTEIAIGAGIAALGIAAVTGIVLYERGKRLPSRKVQAQARKIENR